MQWYSYVLIFSGVGIIADGVGSILLKTNTHGFWYDSERVARTLLGVLLIALGLVIP
jgi:sulfite exporter TauE/SafE